MLLVGKWYFWGNRGDRRSRPEVFCETGVLENFAKFTGKHLCRGSFFNKVASDMQYHYKRDSDADVFLFIFAKFLRSTFFNRISPVAASEESKIRNVIMFL